MNCKHLQVEMYIRMKINEEIKERIKILRNYSKLSQIDFSIQCGLKGQVIINLENGRQYPKHEILAKIIKKYPMFRDWIYFGTENPDTGQISPMTKEVAEKLTVTN